MTELKIALGLTFLGGIYYLLWRIPAEEGDRGKGMIIVIFLVLPFVLWEKVKSIIPGIKSEVA